MLQADGLAPYAPAKTILGVIERHRAVGVSMINVETLIRMGVSESLAPRTQQALRLLDLIDDEGRPTAEFEALRKAGSDQIGAITATLIRNVYAPVFDVVDPTVATVSQIEDAFRSFKPSGQRGRMVSLFTGLMAFAGMVGEAPKQRPGPPRKLVKPAPKASTPVAKPRALVKPVPTISLSNGGDTYAVTLQSGGTLSVVVDVNLFDLSTDDRTFVIELVDKLKGYPKVAQPPTGEEADSS